MNRVDCGFIDASLSAPDCPPRLLPLRRLREDHITALSALRYARELVRSTGDRSIKYEAEKVANRCRKRWWRAREKFIVHHFAK